MFKPQVLSVTMLSRALSLLASSLLVIGILISTTECCPKLQTPTLSAPALSETAPVLSLPSDSTQYRILLDKAHDLSDGQNISQELNDAFKQIDQVGGGVIILPPGTFSWSQSPEHVPEGLILRGQGMTSTVLKLTSSSNGGIVLGSYSHGAHDGFRLERVHVVSKGIPLRLKGMDQMVIANSRFQSTPLILDNCYISRIADNIFNRGSIRLDADVNGSGFGTNQLVVENNIFNNTFTLQTVAPIDRPVPFESIHVHSNWFEDFGGSGHIGIDLALPSYSPLWIERNTFVGIGIHLRASGSARGIRVVNNQVSKGENLDPWLRLDGGGFLESRVMHNYGSGGKLRNGFIQPDVDPRGSRLLVLDNAYEGPSGSSPTYVSSPPARRIHETLRPTKTTDFRMYGVSPSASEQEQPSSLGSVLESLRTRVDSLEQIIQDLREPRNSHY